MSDKANNKILARYLAEAEAKNGGALSAEQAYNMQPPVEELRQGSHAVNYLADSSGFFSIPMEKLPMAMFYPVGTHIEIRPADTGEIQAYSIVDDTNLYDITVKMAEMLSTCARVKRPNGTIGSYREIKDGDRLYLITEIARATRNSALTVDAVCSSEPCKHKNKLEINAKHFVVVTPDDAFVQKFFNEDTGTFVFSMKSNDTTFELGAPSIGLAMDLLAYTMERVKQDEKPNVAFMNCGPWMLHGKDSLSLEQAAMEELKFTKMNRDLFMATDAAVAKMKFGISELRGLCEKCGTEVRTAFRFPNGTRSLFIVPDAFDELIG